MSDHAAVQTFYGRWARLYDVLATAPGVRSWRERTADALGLVPGDTVVEMGCGTGANFPHLRERVGPTGRVVGVDLAPGMLARARDRVRRRGWENVHVAVGDATRAPLGGGVDAVLATFVVGMLSEPAETIRGWLDLLGPGGRLALLNAGRSDRLAGAPLNAAFRLFVRLNAVGGRTARESPARSLEARFGAASAALAERGELVEQRRLGLGFLRLVAAEV
jgi:ubiquinone/menaquinone biosynthesis C-methylase UbiE